MKIWLLIALIPIVSGIFFGKKCESPFSSGYDNGYWKKIWSGFFKCPYDPVENPSLASHIGIFVKFFYIKTGLIDYEEVIVDDMADKLDPNFTTYIIIHGFTDAVRKGEWMEMTAKKIISDQNANVILMDYETLSNCNYIYLAKRVVYELGEYLAENIDYWGLNLNETRIIGHSLGAHVAGNAGIYLYQLTGKKLSRIDGLDPAGPMYGEEKGLNKTSAEFVQVIHTSKIFGTQDRLGHSDFYANRKKMKQPGCLLDTCDHSRATELYYASCFDEYQFIGKECSGGTRTSRFGLYNDGIDGCFEFDTSACFGYMEQPNVFFTFF